MMKNLKKFCIAYKRKNKELAKNQIFNIAIKRDMENLSEGKAIISE